MQWLLPGGSGIVLVLALLAFLMVDFSGSERNPVIQQALSPDARYVAELHEVITPMHGGSDRVEVTWKLKDDASTPSFTHKPLSVDRMTTLTNGNGTLRALS